LTDEFTDNGSCFDPLCYKNCRIVSSGLSRNTWSGLALARPLTRALVRVFAPAGPVVVGLDHTLERRRGPRGDA